MRSNVVGYIAIFLFAMGGTAYATHPGGANTISTGDIQNGQVFTQDIADNNLTSLDVRDDTLAFGGLDAIDLRADSVGTSEIASGAVGSDEIANGSVGKADVDALEHSFIDIGRGGDAVPVNTTATIVADEFVAGLGGTDAGSNVAVFAKVAIDSNVTTASVRNVLCRIINPTGTIIDEIEGAFGGDVSGSVAGVGDSEVFALMGADVVPAGGTATYSLQCDTSGADGDVSAYDGVVIVMNAASGETAPPVLGPTAAKDNGDARAETAPKKSVEGEVK